MLPGIVLSAGDSTRMGSPKALLSAADGRLFVTRIVHTLRGAGCTDVVIVTGRHHEAIVRALSRDDPSMLPLLVHNPEPTRGQLSSLWIGMDAVVSSTTSAVLVTLVDVPMVATATVAHVIEAWRQSRAPIVRPAIGERHGHPVIFDRALFEELRTASLAAGAKSVVRAHEHEILNVAVDDEGCLADVDTPDDYRKLLES